MDTFWGGFRFIVNDIEGTVTDCFLLIDEPHAGTWNMAADEFCALCAAREDVPILRLYCWDGPTLSLGYFQHEKDRQRHPASGCCPVVRRPSGGGAILHHHEWTYSLSLPASHPLAGDRVSLYRTVHGTLVAWLKSLGLNATIIEKIAPPCGTEDRTCPFLCFQRRTVGDVVVSPAAEFAGSCSDSSATEIKVVGSAQRRYRNSLLQHGSVLLARSPFAPELPGVLELFGDADGTMTCQGLLYNFISRWPQIIADAFNWRFIPWRPPLDGTAEFATLWDKFLSDKWTYKANA